MSVNQVATRYAKALLEEAQRQNVLEETFQDIKTLETTIAGSRDLYLMLKSPIVKEGAKRASLDAIFKGNVGQLTYNFLGLLTKKKREGYLVNIIRAFFMAYNELKNIKEVVLISATPLSDEMEKGIVKMIQSQLDASSLDIKKSVDPALLGGFVIKIDDKVFDTSLHHKLNALKRELLAG
jgi:F-type H+-transporting ATPase subunit delta